MNSAPTFPPGAAAAADGTPPSRAYTPGLSDGLGDRLMMFDNATQSSVELLRFKREFSDAPGFEEAVRDRVDELSRFRHPSVAPVRGVQMLDDGLALVSNNTAGRRLSEMVHVARGAPFAIDLIQQLAPALAALHQQGPRLAHGLLTAERIIITREGRLIVVEHVLASAIELIRLPASHFRSEFGIAVPSGTDPIGLNQRSDVVQLGFLALSLLLGRRLDPAHFPANVTTLLDEFTHADGASAARLRPWLERALQQGDRPFASAQDAHAAFGGPQAEITQPAEAEPAASGTAHAVLAFRGPGDAGSSAPAKAKADIPTLDRRSDAYEPPAEPKIELRADPTLDSFEPKKAAHAHAAPPVSSVASPRPAGSKMTAVKWIAAVVVLTGVVVGGLFFAGFFPHATTASTPKPPIAPRPAPASTTTPIDVAPLNAPPAASVTAPPSEPPTAVPAPTVPTAPPTSTSTPDPRSATPPPFGLSARDTSTAPPAATSSVPTTTTTGTTPPSTTLNTPVGPPKPAVPAAPGAFGGVKVSSPIELQVFENGTLVGSTAGPIAVTEGPHTFELVNEPLAFRVRSTVNIRGGQLTPLAITLPSAKVSINAVPWADVFIDGKPAGQTPLANVMVQIGEHKIVFKHPELGEQTQVVIVKADGLTRVSATFKQ